MPLYKNEKSFAIASGGVHFKPEEEKAVKRIIPIKGTLNYNNLQPDKEFSFSLEIVGGTSGATATVQLFDDELLYLTNIDNGPFQDGEELRDTEAVHIADADGIVDPFLSETNPAPYAKSGLLQYNTITFAAAETKLVEVNNRTLILEFMRIVDTDVTIYLDDVLNTPGLLLKPGEYQSMDIRAYEVDTVYLVSAAAGNMAVRQLHT